MSIVRGMPLLNRRIVRTKNSMLTPSKSLLR
jgi:hypothetical protein